MRFVPTMLALAAWLAASVAGAVEPIAPLDLAKRLQQPQPPLVLDVRSPAEFADGHIPGAVLIPHDQIEQQLATLESARDRDIVLYCRSGRRSLLAENVLRDHGFTRLQQLDGSWRAWDAAGLPHATGGVDLPSPQTQPQPPESKKDPSA